MSDEEMAVVAKECQDSVVIQGLHTIANKAVLTFEEWLALRRTGVGGSDIAGLLGLSKWTSPYQLFLDKKGELPVKEETERMYWGKVLEDVVAEEFMRRTGKKVRRLNYIVRHPEHKFMLANVDRLVVGEKAGLECKTTAWEFQREWVDGEMPAEYVLQCMHYMAVTGYKKWYIAVLVGGNKFLHKEIERDEEMITNLIKAEGDFWKRVEDNNPPPPDGSDSATRALLSKYPEGNGETVDLPPTVHEWIEQYHQAKARVKEEEARQQEAENNIKAMLGENEFGRYRSWNVRWKNVSSYRLDTKEVKEKHPQVYEECAKESTSRRFDIKEVK